MSGNLEPRGDTYSQGYGQGYRQAAREIANMLQRKGHDAAALLVANEEHHKSTQPTLAELAER
ncbi:MAG: hypothetical protein ABIP89_12515 [Polyangiaceae bacterium]